MEFYTQLNNVKPKRTNYQWKYPNEKIIISTIEGELDFPMLPNIERQAHILPNIKNSLVSIGALCDAR